LYDENFKKLVRAAYTKIHNYQSAEDLAQDVFELAQRKIEVLLAHPNPTGWLLDVLGKKLMHELRAWGRFRTSMEALAERISKNPPAKGAYDPDGRLGCLTEEEFRMLKLLYCDGFTLRMVAEKMGMTYDTCRRRVQMAKDKARNYGK